jgi:aryl-alcohol dehydrogenase-like predicted oxidoreductase
MIERSLGREGTRLPALGLGCMGMSEFYGSHDDGQSLAVLERALALGCVFWDTSDMYGPHTNELLLGRALKGRRERVFLATKFGIQRGDSPDQRSINGRPQYVAQACEASLKRLGTDHIDLYYQHRVDPSVPIEDTVGAMAALVKAGKVRYLGLSEASASTLARAWAVHPIHALQTEYSLWTRDVEAEILPACRRLGTTLVAYSPLGRGFLTGRIAKPADLEEGDYRRFSPRFQAEAMASNLKLLEAVKAVAQAHGATGAQVALAWVLSRGDEVMAIPGTKKVAYLLENWAAQDLELSAADLTALDAAFPLQAAQGTRYPEAMMKTLNA